MRMVLMWWGGVEVGLSGGRVGMGWVGEKVLVTGRGVGYGVWKVEGVGYGVGRSGEKEGVRGKEEDLVESLRGEGMILGVVRG